jgi:hypothetical protein
MIFIPLGCLAVAMKNTHHAEMDELLIGRDLSWVEEGGIFRDEAAKISKSVPKTKSVRYTIPKRKKAK